MTEVIWVHPPIDSRCPYQILTSTQWIVQGFRSGRGPSGEPSDGQTDSGIAAMAHRVFSPPLATAHARFWSRTGAVCLRQKLQFFIRLLGQDGVYFPTMVEESSAIFL